MEVYKVDTKFWKELNTKTNIGSFMQHMFGLERVVPKDDGTYLYCEWDKVPMQQNAYGKALNAVAKYSDPLKILELVDKSYRKEDPIYLHERFNMDDSDNLVIWPCDSPRLLETTVEYCHKLYPDKHDFEFNTSTGFQAMNAIIYLDDIEPVMEDISFLTLQDADIHAIYEYKVKNMMPLTEIVSREDLEEKGVL